jgi:lysyl-tRNA synthetase class 1
MHWADKLAKEIVSSKKFQPFWVDDMKTPSGFAHVGSLMGPVFHSLIYRSLQDLGEKSKFTFVINDFDHADSLPSEYKEEYGKYLGMSLKMIPSPDPKFENMADLFKNDFLEVMESLGVEAKVLSSWEMYHAGEFDEVIKLALDNSEKIQDIYQEVSGSRKKEKGWLPFQVVCEKCGKLGTTRVFAWDGKEVSYKCEPEMVTWAQGCGHEGKTSPFKGNGKLPWKVDWPAHWKVIGVTIEGAGKDHGSAGGSYDIAMEICKEVFKYPQPYKAVYEFLLIGGRKMSSSKGLGFKAHDLVKALPPSIARFLFARTDYKKQSNFEPLGTMAIPDLFDEYDKCWQAYVDGSDEDLSRTFVLSQVGEMPKKEKTFLPRFRDVVNYLQQPSVDIKQAFPEVNEKILAERIKYAKIWLAKYAPSEFQLTMSADLPRVVEDLTGKQKEYLAEVLQLIEGAQDSEALQADLYSLAKKLEIPTKEAFSAIYLAFLGKTHGPKAAWFLLQYPKEKVIARLKEVSR